MTTQQPEMAGLRLKAKAWRDALKDADTGPLRIAADVVKVGEDWETWRSEAGGADCTTWLRSEFGKGRGLAFFRRIDAAVVKIGEHCRRTYNWQTACYVAQNVPADKLDDVKSAIRFATKGNGGMPLSYVQGQLVVRGILKKTVKHKSHTCDRCKVLERFIADHGMVPPG
ncbi:MAG: hypothetical protein WC911_10895 [Thermoleophilia bacterium]